MKQYTLEFEGYKETVLLTMVEVGEDVISGPGDSLRVDYRDRSHFIVGSSMPEGIPSFRILREVGSYTTVEEAIRVAVGGPEATVSSCRFD